MVLKLLSGFETGVAPCISIATVLLSIYESVAQGERV